MIEVRGLSKRYGDKIAVNNLSFSVAPGKVTGFLGPNGAGKTTTMRLILGLDYPNAGTVTIAGPQYAQLAYPMREVGALIDAKAVHGGRSAYNHLLCLAQTNNLPKRRALLPGPAGHRGARGDGAHRRVLHRDDQDLADGDAQARHRVRRQGGGLRRRGPGGHEDPHLFAPWNQFAVFAVYTVILLGAGALLFRKRDA